jgi:hypothetical protein
MKNKLIIKVLLILMFIPLSFSSTDTRVQIRIPFKSREEILSNMRLYLKSVERMIYYLSVEDFKSFVIEAKKLTINQKGVEKLKTRGNLNFATEAYVFHSKGVNDLIEPAEKRDLKRTLLALSKFTNKCNSCHDQYKLMEWPSVDYGEAPRINFEVPKK